MFALNAGRLCALSLAAGAEHLRIAGILHAAECQVERVVKSGPKSGRDQIF